MPIGTTANSATQGGLNFVSLLCQAEQLTLPLAIELVRKTVPIYHPKTQKNSYQSAFTKNEHLQQMLRVAQEQAAYRYPLPDSWYASAENMTLMQALTTLFSLLKPPPL